MFCDFAGPVSLGVDETGGTDGAGLGIDIIVGVWWTGYTLLAVPDRQVIGAHSADPAIVEGGGFIRTEAVSDCVFSLVISAFLASLSVVVPGGGCKTGDASSGI